MWTTSTACDGNLAPFASWLRTDNFAPSCGSQPWPPLRVASSPMPKPARPGGRRLPSRRRCAAAPGTALPVVSTWTEPSGTAWTPAFDTCAKCAPGCWCSGPGGRRLVGLPSSPTTSPTSASSLSNRNWRMTRSDLAPEPPRGMNASLACPRLTSDKALACSARRSRGLRSTSGGMSRSAVLSWWRMPPYVEAWTGQYCSRAPAGASGGRGVPKRCGWRSSPTD